MGDALRKADPIAITKGQVMPLTDDRVETDMLLHNLQAVAEERARKSENLKPVAFLEGQAADAIAALLQRAEEAERERPLTAANLADALGCFWNAAIGEAHNRQSSTAMDCAAVVAEGLNAIAVRLKEQSQ